MHYIIGGWGGGSTAFETNLQLIRMKTESTRSSQMAKLLRNAKAETQRCTACPRDSYSLPRANSLNERRMIFQLPITYSSPTVTEPMHVA